MQRWFKFQSSFLMIMFIRQLLGSKYKQEIQSISSELQVRNRIKKKLWTRLLSLMHFLKSMLQRNLYLMMKARKIMNKGVFINLPRNRFICQRFLIYFYHKVVIGGLKDYQRLYGSLAVGPVEQLLENFQLTQLQNDQMILKSKLSKLKRYTKDCYNKSLINTSSQINQNQNKPTVNRICQELKLYEDFYLVLLILIINRFTSI
ncbi:hypothetical protein pb186bvf_012883 [Paramecium bursaria]